MPWTLQRYIFREMGKTFLLATAALTGVLGLGGGVFHVVKLGEVTPGQLLSLMALVLPVTAALTLPIAVLFSATVTYGRLSADNEFVACRSGGINMHVLFLPTLVLGLASACLTFVLINFVMPGMVHNLNSFLVADVGALIRERLERPRGISLGGRVRIRADPSGVEVTDEGGILVRDIVFAELDGYDWMRFGTAREVRLHVDLETQRARAQLIDLSFYDRREGFKSAGELTIWMNQPFSAVPQKLRFLNLGELLHYRRHPEAWQAVRARMQKLRLAVGRTVLLDDLWREWRSADRTLTLSDETASYVVRSQEGAQHKDGTVELGDVTVEQRRGFLSSVITAQRAYIEIARGDSDDLESAGVRIELHEVVSTDGQAKVSKKKLTLGPVAIDSAILARVNAMSDEALLLQASKAPVDGKLAARGREAREAWDETVRRITATLNERMAFSASVLVLVILGAALGIAFRGAHILTAFGISFVPSLAVIVAIVMGKQMAHNEPTHLAGLAVMWGGIGAMALLDLWVLTRVVRR